MHTETHLLKEICRVLYISHNWFRCSLNYTTARLGARRHPQAYFYVGFRLNLWSSTEINRVPTDSEEEELDSVQGGTRTKDTYRYCSSDWDDSLTVVSIRLYSTAESPPLFSSHQVEKCYIQIKSNIQVCGIKRTAGL